MGMPVSKAGELSLGHAFSPSPITPSTTKVMAMNSPPHVATDVIGVHVLGNSAHGGTILNVSTKVFAQSKGLARLMDGGDCGAMIAGSGAKILVGG